MKRCARQNSGILMLIRRYKQIFRIPENLNHYTKADYILAEKKFVKYALAERI